MKPRQVRPAAADMFRPTVRLLLEQRRPLIVLFHLGLIALSSYGAIWLRFDGRIPEQNWQPWLRALPWLLVLRALTFARFRLYEGLWRYTGLWDLKNILSAVVLSSLAHYLLVHWTLGWTGYPRAVFIIDSGVLVLLMGGVRMIRRMVTELRYTSGERRVLVYGAGDAGEMIVRDMRSKSNQPYRPIGFIDDNRAKVGLRIHGVPVLGTRYGLSAILERYRPHEVLIAIPRAEPTAMRSIVRSLEPFKIPIKTLPNLRDLIDRKVEIAKIRSLSVEDLLARAPVGLDIAPVKALIGGRRVLVTGAGGSIGSELCRQIADLKPASLVMFERYENSLHTIRLELEDTKRQLRVHAVVGDVTDSARVHEVMRRHSPEIVFHAAAHKHVPLMEENPCEAIKNNVRGTRLLAQTAKLYGVDRFILISTDKAVNPTSVMGASKRLAELVVQAQAAGSGTSFSVVRFGNVLASNGSVVPRFLEQIGKGGPVTITHPEMRRFFMLIPEAVQLVLHAASQAENAATYVLEMGEQVKVLDMARDLIRQSGLVPEEDIKIEFIGLRPGEKLYEELVGSDEESSPLAADKILCVRSRRRVAPDFMKQVEVLEADAADDHTDVAVRGLKQLIGTFASAVDDSVASLKTPVSPPHRLAPARKLGHDEQWCKQCHIGCLRRLRERTLADRAMKWFTAERLYGCDDCGWRGWLLPQELGEEPVHAPSQPDLALLDATPQPRR